jgi:hypothetical protein
MVSCDMPFGVELKEEPPQPVSAEAATKKRNANCRENPCPIRRRLLSSIRLNKLPKPREASTIPLRDACPGRVD